MTSKNQMGRSNSFIRYHRIGSESGELASVQQRQSYQNEENNNTCERLASPNTFGARFYLSFSQEHSRLSASHALFLLSDVALRDIFERRPLERLAHSKMTKWGTGSGGMEVAGKYEKQEEQG